MFNIQIIGDMYEKLCQEKVKHHYYGKPIQKFHSQVSKLREVSHIHVGWLLEWNCNNARRFLTSEPMLGIRPP